MTTRQFIEQQYGKPRDKKRWCSSVLADYNGDIYSYGYHYPLLFNVEGVTFLNTAGYSSSTGRHIHWSRGVEHIEVELPSRSGYYSQDYTKEQILDYLTARVARAKEAMDAKKRKDTQVYRWLEYEYNRARVQKVKAKEAWA